MTVIICCCSSCLACFLLYHGHFILQYRFSCFKAFIADIGIMPNYVSHVSAFCFSFLYLILTIPTTIVTLRLRTKNPIQIYIYIYMLPLCMFKEIDEFHYNILQKMHFNFHYKIIKRVVITIVITLNKIRNWLLFQNNCHYNLSKWLN